MTSSFLTAIRSLHFQEDRRAELRRIDPLAWPQLLKLTDRSHITLPLGVRCREELPDEVRNRIDQNLAGNALRYERIVNEYRLIAGVLRARSIDFVVLKGLSQIAPLYVGDSRQRPQYDIDLYCPPRFLEAARDAMLDAGFSPVRPHGKHTDHIPAMIRNRNWKWRGDYYALDLPLTVELHFRFWDPSTERLPVACVEDFWRRRTSRVIDGMEIPMLGLSDGVSYSALHLMRHLLRGDLRAYHVYELAHFLHQTAQHDELWNAWRDHRSAQTPVIETVAFRLAAAWFGCNLHPIVEESVRAMPRNIVRWFDLFSHSPLAVERPNKDELFLHLSLLGNTRDRRSIVARRLLPLRASRLVDPAPTDTKSTFGTRLRATFRQCIFIGHRVQHHLNTTPPLIRSLFRWKMSSAKYAVS